MKCKKELIYINRKIMQSKQLLTHSHSIWLDYIQRDLIAGGELQRLIEEDVLRRRITSSPSFFDGTIASGHKDSSDIQTIYDTTEYKYENMNLEVKTQQSQWLEYLRQDIIANTELSRLIKKDGHR
jgi:transaldolase